FAQVRLLRVGRAETVDLREQLLVLDCDLRCDGRQQVFHRVLARGVDADVRLGSGSGDMEVELLQEARVGLQEGDLRSWRLDLEQDVGDAHGASQLATLGEAVTDATRMSSPLRWPWTSYVWQLSASEQ